MFFGFSFKFSSKFLHKIHSGEEMNERISAFIFSLTTVLLLLNQPVIGQNDVILPLAIGNYWEFIDSTFSNDTLFVVDTSKVGITGKLDIEYQGNNYEVFYWNWFDMNTNPPQPVPRKWLIRNEPDGLWEYGMLNDTDTLLLQNLTMKFPANIGDSWPIMAYIITDTSISVGDTLMMECIDTDQEYITQSGTFQCYVYRYEWIFLKSYKANFVYPSEFIESIYNSQNTKSDTFRVLSYFAPNVGFVGKEYRLGSFKTKSYLISYELVTNVKTAENSSIGFQLYQNYPNPFNPITTISFSIPERSYVNLKVYDVLGNEVVTLVSEEREAGNHTVDFNASDLPSGVYLYKMTSGNYSETKKMLLLR